MKKILVVGLSSKIGGVEKIVLNLCQKFGENTIVDAMVFDTTCSWEDAIIRHGGTVFYLPSRGKNPFRNYLSQKQFWLQNKDTYDFVWIHMSSASNITAHKLIKRYTKTPIISHSHGTFFESQNFVYEKIHGLLNKINHHTLVEYSDYRLACSQAAGMWLFGTAEFSVMNNAVEIDKYTFNEDIRSSIRTKLGLTNELVITHVGRFSYVKNHEFIVDVFGEIHEMCNGEAYLLLVGDGEMLPQIREKVNTLGLAQYVRFLGFVDNVNEIMSCSDVFVLPSHFEGFPVTLVEAQANGLKCFVSDNLSKDVAVTDLVSFISLEESAKTWASRILQSKYTINRRDSSQRMQERGYDIIAVSRRLERFIESNDVQYLRD